MHYKSPDLAGARRHLFQHLKEDIMRRVVHWHWLLINCCLGPAESSKDVSRNVYVQPQVRLLGPTASVFVAPRASVFAWLV